MNNARLQLHKPNTFPIPPTAPPTAAPTPPNTLSTGIPYRATARVRKTSSGTAHVEVSQFHAFLWARFISNEPDYKNKKINIKMIK
jgi:hypothetical protein